MSKHQSAIGCPFCDLVSKIDAPDKVHTTWSLKKVLIVDEAADDIVEEKLVCPNPKCNKKFTVYWFDF